MYTWKKGIAQWVVKDTLHLSVVFTWDLPDALLIAQTSKKKVVVGGPAVKLIPGYFGKSAKEQETTVYPALAFHNPMATFTSRGCTNTCGFCAVPKLEGGLRELKDFPVRPIICDNNLLACSSKHFNNVIDSLKTLPFVDFNQGLEADIFTTHHASRIAELKNVMIRFAFDHINDELVVVDAINRAKQAGIKNIGCYVLVGYKDTPEDARYRLELLKSLGVLMMPMRYQPLDSTLKNSYLDKNWTEDELNRTCRYWARQNYLEHIPFEEFRGSKKHSVNQIGLFD